MADGNRHIDVCIVCAKADEAQAVVKEFSSRCRVSYKQDFIESDNNYKYEYDYMEIKNEKKEALTVLVTCLAYQGPVQTASFVTFLLNTFHPRFAAMTGYCAGDKTELNLGDLVVAEAAYHYEEGKVKEVEDGQKLHVPLIRPKEPAINIIQYVNRFNTWKKPVGNITPPEIENALADSNQVKCLVGYMASGMAVRRDNLFEELRSHNHKTVALEMEAAAFYEAVSSFSDIYSLVVKGVCDYADMNKHDKYHEYAARVSATYLLYFIRRYVTEATMPRRDNHQNPQDTLLGGRGIPTSVVFEQFPELRAICSDITERRLSTVREKYSEGLYLQREHVHRAFMRFLEDPTKRGFVLVGGSGVGKSNFLLAARKELQSQESVCMLMYDAASLEHPLVETIEEDFHQQRRAWTTQRLWEKIENIDGIDKRLVLLCMDALNEHEQPRPLLRQLNELIQRPWPWLKVVIVSRPEAWQSIRYGVKLAEALYYRGEGATLGAILESFNYSERLEPFSRQELPLVYAKYKQVNEVQTAYEDLSGRLRDIISDPFNLWLVTKTYKTIPEHLKTTTLITEYIYALTKDPQSKRLQGGDPDWLENQLIPLMVRKVVRKEPYANVITSDELNDADPPLYKALLARADSSELPQHQSFTNLVDAGILRRKPREIGFAIDFKYERFYDYFVGRRLFHMSEAPQTDRYGYFLDMIGRTTEYPYLWGAIRNALIQEAEKPNIEIVLELCRTPDQHVREMMVSVLTALGADAPQKVESILKELVPAARRATTIKRVRQWQGKATVDADRPAWYAGRIATEVASNLDMPGLLQTAALQEDSTIRTEAVRFAFHLWKRDQPAGFAILEHLTQRTTSDLIPERAALESTIGLSMSILFDSNQDEQVLRRLQGFWHDIIARMLAGEHGKLWERILRRLFFSPGRIFSTVIDLVIGYIDKLPNYGEAFNIPDLEAFFRLKPDADERALYTRLVSYIDVEGDYSRDQMERDFLAVMMQTNNYLIVFMAQLGLIAHACQDPLAFLPFLQRFYEEAKKDVVAYPYMNDAIHVLDNVLHRGPMDDALFNFFVAAVEECQEFYIRHPEAIRNHKYRETPEVHDLGPYIFHLYRKTGSVKTAWLETRIQSALERKDTRFFELLLTSELSLIGIERQSPRAALSTVAMFFRQSNADIRSQIQKFLAHLRAYYPNEVDEFLEEQGADDNFRLQIQVREPEGSIGTLIGQRSLYFLRDNILMQSPILRSRMLHLLGEAADCGSIRIWLEYFLREAINLLYGGEILHFPE